MTTDKPSDKQTETGFANQSDAKSQQPGNTDAPNSKTMKPSESSGTLLYGPQSNPYLYSTEMEIETNDTPDSPPPPPSTPIGSPLPDPSASYYIRHQAYGYVDNVNYSIVCEIHGSGPDDNFEDVDFND
ncbi:unnamed protein product [Ambrosiozyma monospora]|uniref:Unnamed protein product n=1 Tax=Ambrosiozyma monospora TaxID=43982 RepID=A0ACB5SXF8_AMBMO|nr:unnamed protein product [Ambrosiozyma monospora]